MLHKTLILLGGNQPETPWLFEQSMAMIKLQIGPILKSSADYESAPWGFSANHNFRNRVIEVETDKKPVAQLQALLEIEALLGRKRKENRGYESRGIDLDILLIDDLILETPKLIVPHPRLHLRRFTLEPLCEHWSNTIHPLLNKTMGELLKTCTDVGSVKRSD
jgi:2-amino-4-hydroxy-6-hydroxymethyldihydropteridine diphosphokinase